MEALLLNSSAVFLKWKPPALTAQNGLLTSYFVIIRGVDMRENSSRILTNVTIDAATPTLLLANLTWGVTYTVSVAAANNAGLGPFSAPAPLRLDPRTKRLEQSMVGNRHTISDGQFDDFLMKPWFILLLGLLLAVMMLAFGAMVFVRRKHLLMKQSSEMRRSTSQQDTGILKSLPRSSHKQFWLDPETTLWRQTMQPPLPKDQQHTTIPDYSPVTHNNNNNDYGRGAFGYKEYAASEYAEVSSTFRKGVAGMAASNGEYSSSRARSPAPYATTTMANDGQLRTQFCANPDLLIMNRHQATHPGLYMENMRLDRPPVPTYHRSIHSDSYFNPLEGYYDDSDSRYCHPQQQQQAHLQQQQQRGGKPLNCATFNARCSNSLRNKQKQHQQYQQQLRRFKISQIPKGEVVGGGGGEDVRVDDRNGNMNMLAEHANNVDGGSSKNNQFYVKVGETSTKIADSGSVLNWNNRAPLLPPQQQQQQQHHNSLKSCAAAAAGNELNGFTVPAPPTTTSSSDFAGCATEGDYISNESPHTSISDADGSATLNTSGCTTTNSVASSTATATPFLGHHGSKKSMNNFGLFAKQSNIINCPEHV